MRAVLCHQYDVVRSRDVIGRMTIRLSIDDFLYVLNRNQTRISLCFHDAITPGSTIRVNLITLENASSPTVLDGSRQSLCGYICIMKIVPRVRFS